METRKIWYKTEQSEYALMRIPGITVASRGEIIIYGEARRSGSDWAHMDIVMRKSRDGGESFSAPQVLARGTSEHPTVNNPVMAEDARGVLHFLYCEDYGTRGGKILHRKSRDSGETWEAPEDITYASLPEYRNVFALGPGHGICTKSGALAFPFWLVPKKFGRAENAHIPSEVGVLYSEDNGESWRTSPLLPARGDIVSPNESVAAELPDGGLYLAIRQNAPARAHAVLERGFSGFRAYEPVPGLCDPVCFGSAAYAFESLLFVNCDDSEKRRNITLQTSADCGKSWRKILTVDEARGGYADIAADTARGKIYVLYENEFGKELYFAAIDREEII